MISIHKLSNGINVAVYSNASLHSFNLRIHVKGGSLVETSKNNGVAHFMEHMLVQGIPSYPSAQEMSSYIESIAGRYGAYTSKLTIAFEITVPSAEYKKACQIASEVYFEPLFPQEAIEKERIAVLNEIQQKYDSQQYKLHKFFQEVRYRKNSRMLFDTGGSVPVVKQLTRDDLVAFWQKYFVTQNMYVLVVSHMKEQDVLKLLEEYFGNRKTKSAQPGFPKLTANEFADSKVVTREQKDLFVNYIDLSFPAAPLDAALPIRMQQNMAIALLGRLRTSRLFRLLRYQKGLVYGVSSSYSSFPGIGTGYISSEVENAYLDQVADLIISTFSTFITDGPTDEEMALIKHYFASAWQMAYDNPDSLASWIENGLLWEKQILLPRDYIPYLEKITKKDLLTMMRKHWDIHKINLVVQGPGAGKISMEKYKKLIKTLR